MDIAGGDSGRHRRLNHKDAKDALKPVAAARKDVRDGEFLTGRGSM